MGAYSFPANDTKLPIDKGRTVDRISPDIFSDADERLTFASDFSLEGAVRGLSRMRRGDVVLTGGSFDLMHAGHARFLSLAKEEGKILIVGVTSDIEVSRRKGPTRPILHENYRAEMVSNLKSVDLVFISRDDFGVSAIPRLMPSKVVIGDCDYQSKSDKVWCQTTQERYPRVHFVFIPRQMKDLSTTDVERRVCERNFIAQLHIHPSLSNK